MLNKFKFKKFVFFNILKIFFFVNHEEKGIVKPIFFFLIKELFKFCFKIYLSLIKGDFPDKEFTKLII